MSYKSGLNRLQGYIDSLREVGLGSIADKLQEIFDSIIEDDPEWFE